MRSQLRGELGVIVKICIEAERAETVTLSERGGASARVPRATLPEAIRSALEVSGQVFWCAQRLHGRHYRFHGAAGAESW